MSGSDMLFHRMSSTGGNEMGASIQNTFDCFLDRTTGWDGELTGRIKKLKLQTREYRLGRWNARMERDDGKVMRRSRGEVLPE